LRDFNKALQHCKYNFYADDLLIYMHAKVKNIYEAIYEMNEDINRTIQWENKFNIN